MPRPKLIRSTVLPYHVRSRSNNREWFHLPTERVWQIMGGILNTVTLEYQALIHSFVLMNNHLHLILSTPNGNLDAIMQYFIRESAKAIGRESGRINRIFGGRYQRSLLSNEQYFLNAIKYNFRNPVAAKICDRAEEYPFSTLNWTLGRGRPLFPLSEEPDFLFRLLPRNELLTDWLNVSYTARQSEVVRLGLRRSTCGWPKGNAYKTAIKGLSGPPGM